MEEADSALKNLLEGSVNVKTESLALHDHVEKLMSLYQARETQLIATVAEMRSKCASIIEEATDKASSIHAAAQKASVDSAKVAADTISAAKTTAAEEVDGATEKGQKLIADASAQAAAILATAMKEREDWEAEKASVADIQKFKPELKANVGGTKFTTSLTTLCRFPDTMIGAMYSGRHELVQDDEGYHFIDRDGTHFRYILNFLRAPENFKSQNPQRIKVIVTQEENGIFTINGIPVCFCEQCSIGDYASNPAASIEYDDYYRNDGDEYYHYIQNLSKLIRDKKGVIITEQPKVVSPCRICYS
eukprot:gene10208-11947_t